MFQPGTGEKILVPRPSLRWKVEEAWRLGWVYPREQSGGAVRCG